MRKKRWDIPKKNNKSGLKSLLFLLVGGMLLVVIYFLPPVHDRLSWRLDSLRASIYYFFNPPGEAVFTPEQQAEMAAIIDQTKTAIAVEPTATIEPTPAPTNVISPTPTITATFTPTPIPIPDAVSLTGELVYQKQLLNNCGPANLSMALSFWGWEGSQADTAAVVKPKQQDKNVMAYEMASFVRSETNFNVVLRYGGDLDLLKKFIAAGFPVLIEKGYEEEAAPLGWMGHYGVITGYDDNTETFIVQDSFVRADYANSYEKIQRHWRSFNYLYMIIYPPEKGPEVMEILGPQADETYNLQYAAQKAQEEIPFMEGRELFFAWFNYGTSLVELQDYYGAAQAYDYALNELYQEIPISQRPWRMLWYQTGPYFAYFYTARYRDVVALATRTIDEASVAAIEESYVWRGRALVALGDRDAAIRDFRKALEWHPGWWVAEAELQYLGIEP